MVKRTFLLNLLKYVLAVGVLAVVIWLNWEPGSDKGLEYVWNKHAVRGEPINATAFALAFLIGASSLSLTLVRWYVLVRAQDLPFRLRDAFRLGLIAFPFNNILPGSVGGDAIKAAGLARSQSRRTVAVATVLMDRAIALWALVWFVALFGGAAWALGMLNGPAAAVSHKIITAAGVIVVLSVAVWGLLGLLPERRAARFAGRLSRIPKVGHSAAEFWRAVWMYRCRQRSVAAAMLLSWVGQVGFVFAFYFSVLTLWDPKVGGIPSIAEHFLLVPIGLVIQAMPGSPGGIGIGEAGFGGLYAWFGCAASIAVVGSLFRRVVDWAIALVGYLIWLRMKGTCPTEERPTQARPVDLSLVRPVHGSDAVVAK